jgi:hypothetical protein
VSYSFCLQGASGTGYSPAFACKASMKSEGADNLRSGGTSGSFRATNIVFVACEGGSNPDAPGRRPWKLPVLLAAGSLRPNGTHPALIQVSSVTVVGDSITRDNW